MGFSGPRISVQERADFACNGAQGGGLSHVHVGEMVRGCAFSKRFTKRKVVLTIFNQKFSVFNISKIEKNLNCLIALDKISSFYYRKLH